jgi:hypothetical protein
MTLAMRKPDDFAFTRLGAFRITFAFVATSIKYNRRDPLKVSGNWLLFGS